MSENFYKAPTADLTRLEEQGELTASERWAQSRREMDAVNARSKLNLVWGLRLVVDIILLGYFAFLIILEGVSTIQLEGLFFVGFIILYHLLEVFCIVGYFRSKHWSIVPLHIFAAISLINLPFGTALSITHFIYAGKLNFEKP